MPGGAVIARLHGKLPAHGDFVSRGFSRGEAEACDAWLSASLAGARARHGEAFEARYDHAPPWRYVDDGVAGALAPSQDAAGRRYPVYLERSPVTEGAAVAGALEELLFEAIAGCWTADALVAAAELIDADGTGDSAAAPGWWLEGGDQRLAEARPADLLSHMLGVEVSP